MSVIKVKIQKDFTVLYNGVLENPRLSFKAKGLWAYCMSRPDNWEFHVSHLATVSKDKEDRIYSSIKELMAEGLVERVQKNENGKFSNIDYIIYPYPAELKKCLPQPGFPDAGFPDAGNPALTSTDSEQELKENKKECAMPSARSPSLSSKRKKTKEERVEVAPGVSLTPTQQSDILRRLKGNEEKVGACYDKLSSWKISKEIDGGNDYQTILNWVIGAVAEDAAKPKPEDRAAEDGKYARRVADKHPTHPDITLGHNYIEFRMGSHNTQHIKFGDFSFQEQVDNALRKMGLSLSAAPLSQNAPVPPKINDQDKRVGQGTLERQQRVLRHKEQAAAWSGQKWKNYLAQWEGGVVAKDDRVEFLTVSGMRTVYYHVSDEVWATETGWTK